MDGSHLTYEQLLAKQPASFLGGNQDAARRFVDEIGNYLAGPTSLLSTSQRNYLYKLRGTWVHRASGADQRWNEFGSRPGRKKGTRKPTSADVDPTAYGDVDELDPLLRAIMTKFGKRRVDET